MNWDQIAGRWKRCSGAARERWGKLTGSKWQTIVGKKVQLVGRIQERYGVAIADAEQREDEQALAQKGTKHEKRSAIRY